MSSREDDWIRQARRDLDQARTSAGAGFYEWACFAAQPVLVQEPLMEAWDDYFGS